MYTCIYTYIIYNCVHIYVYYILIDILKYVYVVQERDKLPLKYSQTFVLMHIFTHVSYIYIYKCVYTY